MSALRRPAAALLALGLLASCATVTETGRRSIEGDRGGVRVAVFQDDDALEAGRTLEQPVAGVLERRVGPRQWTPVFRSLDPSWTVVGLEPGRYRVRFDLALDETGQPEDLERPVREEVEIGSGEVVDVALVLDHVSPAMVAAGAVAVVVAAVLLHEWLDGLDLPTPPPPPAWALEAAFWITLDLASEPAVWVPRARAPQVTSHFPRAGEIVAPGPVRVVFALSEPIERERLTEDAIRVETLDGLELPGRVSWDEERWWLVWEPEDDLPADTVLRASLRADVIADSLGLELAGATGFDFETSP